MGSCTAKIMGSKERDLNTLIRMKAQIVRCLKHPAASQVINMKMLLNEISEENCQRIKPRNKQTHQLLNQCRP